MKHEAETLSPNQSLELITYMIQQAKGNVQRNSFQFLLWGWVTVIANLGMFVLYQVDYPHPYIVWLITIPAWAISLYKAFRTKKTSSSSTHIGNISLSLWLCYGLTTFAVVAIGSKINFQISGLILLLTSIPTYTTGVILKFTPMKIGGIVFWLGGVLSFFVPMETQPLIGAVTLAGGYLVPGYMLKSTD